MKATRQGIKELLKEIQGAEFIEDEIMSILDQWEGSVKDAKACLEIKSIDDLSNVGEAFTILDRLEDALY